MAPLPFVQSLVGDWPLERWQSEVILIACSGGADSVALAWGLHLALGQAPGRLVLGHVHHQLRGPEADADAAFVESLAGRLRRTCLQAQLEPQAGTAQKLPSEAALRQARYQALLAFAKQSGARYIATAHTADDQAETLLLRMARGTGLCGLRGIPRVRPLSPEVSLVRPMLQLRRRQGREFLTALGESWREDASNRDRRYARNQVRHAVLPALAQAVPGDVVENLCRLANQAAHVWPMIEQAVKAILPRAVIEQQPRCLRLQAAVLADQTDFLLRESLRKVWKLQGWPERAMTQAKWALLADLCRQAASGTVAARHFPGGILVSAHHGVLELRAAADEI